MRTYLHIRRRRSAFAGQISSNKVRIIKPRMSFAQTSLVRESKYAGSHRTAVWELESAGNPG